MFSSRSNLNGLMYFLDPCSKSIIHIGGSNISPGIRIGHENGIHIISFWIWSSILKVTITGLSSRYVGRIAKIGLKCHLWSGYVCIVIYFLMSDCSTEISNKTEPIMIGLPRRDCICTCIHAKKSDVVRHVLISRYQTCYRLVLKFYQ